jgi:hypothetical protein
MEPFGHQLVTSLLRNIYEPYPMHALQHNVPPAECAQTLLYTVLHPRSCRILCAISVPPRQTLFSAPDAIQRRHV